MQGHNLPSSRTRGQLAHRWVNGRGDSSAPRPFTCPQLVPQIWIIRPLSLCPNTLKSLSLVYLDKSTNTPGNHAGGHSSLQLSGFLRLQRTHTQNQVQSRLLLRSEGGHERRGRTRSDECTDPQMIITTLASNRRVCQAKVKTALKLLRKKV